MELSGVSLLFDQMVFPWYALCLLFVLPFFDPRRPFRLLHLDLLVLLVIGIKPLSFFLVGGAISDRAVAVTVIGLLYLLGRLVWSAFHPGKSRDQLLPVVPVAWLAIGIVLLTGFKLAYVVTDSTRVIDVGQATVLGADRIADGRDIYDGGLGDLVEGGDTYGPVTYLAYVPFEQAFPSDNRFTTHHAASAAAMTFDVLVLIALLAVGRRLRRGREGMVLGVALAYAWASYPYSFLVLRNTFNDSVLVLLTLAALFATTRPPARGALAALAAATKFAPAVLAPMLATANGENRVRSALLFSAAFIAVTVAVFLPFLPDGGLHELYDRTFAYQRSREAWMMIWRDGIPARELLQTAVQVAVVGMALLFAVVPRRKTLTQLAALGGALLIAAQLATTNWAPNYAVWFAPLACVGFFAAYGTRDSETPTVASTGHSRRVQARGNQRSVGPSAES
jgi:hypothetical protein